MSDELTVKKISTGTAIATNADKIAVPTTEAEKTASAGSVFAGEKVVDNGTPLYGKATDNETVSEGKFVANEEVKKAEEVKPAKSQGNKITLAGEEVDLEDVKETLKDFDPKALDGLLSMLKNKKGNQQQIEEKVLSLYKNIKKYKEKIEDEKKEIKKLSEEKNYEELAKHDYIKVLILLGKDSEAFKEFDKVYNKLQRFENIKKLTPPSQIIAAGYSHEEVKEALKDKPNEYKEYVKIKLESIVEKIKEKKGDIHIYLANSVFTDEEIKYAFGENSQIYQIYKNTKHKIVIFNANYKPTSEEEKINEENKRNTIKHLAEYSHCDELIKYGYSDEEVAEVLGKDSPEYKEYLLQKNAALSTEEYSQTSKLIKQLKETAKTVKELALKNMEDGEERTKLIELAQKLSQEGTALIEEKLKIKQTAREKGADGLLELHYSYEDLEHVLGENSPTLAEYFKKLPNEEQKRITEEKVKKSARTTILMPFIASGLLESGMQIGDLFAPKQNQPETTIPKATIPETTIPELTISGPTRFKTKSLAERETDLEESSKKISYFSEVSFKFPWQEVFDSIKTFGNRKPNSTKSTEQTLTQTSDKTAEAQSAPAEASTTPVNMAQIEHESMAENIRAAYDRNDFEGIQKYKYDDEIIRGTLTPEEYAKFVEWRNVIQEAKIAEAQKQEAEIEANGKKAKEQVVRMNKNCSELDTKGVQLSGGRTLCIAMGEDMYCQGEISAPDATKIFRNAARDEDTLRNGKKSEAIESVEKTEKIIETVNEHVIEKTSDDTKKQSEYISASIDSAKEGMKETNEILEKRSDYGKDFIDATEKAAQKELNHTKKLIEKSNLSETEKAEKIKYLEAKREEVKIEAKRIYNAFICKVQSRANKKVSRIAKREYTKQDEIKEEKQETIEKKEKLERKNAKLKELYEILKKKILEYTNSFKSKKLSDADSKRLKEAESLQAFIENKISKNESKIRLEKLEIENFNNARDLSLQKVSNKISSAAATIAIFS